MAQVNLGRGYAAQKECVHAAAHYGISVLLVQEPYVGAKAHVNIPQCRIIQKITNNRDKPVKSAVFVFDQNISVIENPDLICENIVAVVVKIKCMLIGIISVYLEKDKDIIQDLNRITEVMRGLKTDSIIIGGDINSKSPWWGCETEDDRGSRVMESLAQLNLHVLNEGKKPTFYIVRNNRECTSIVDVTICTSNLIHRVKGWEVDPNLVTLSDHRAIRFNFDPGSNINSTIQRKTTRKYNTSKSKWLSFTQIFTSSLIGKGISEDSLNDITTPEALQRVVHEYVASVTEASEEAIPKISSSIYLGKTAWWTKNLTEKKREMITKRNKIRRANPRRKPFVISDYLSALEEYKELMRQTIIDSWKKFCKRQDRETVWDGIYRIIRKQAKNEGDRLLRSPEDQRIMNPKESAELMAATFYPQDDPNTDSPEQKELRETVHRSIQNLGFCDHRKFTLEEIELVLANMSPKKSPGDDGLTSDICTRAFQANPNVLLGLYNKCLELAYFPESWKTARIKIIPKPHKEDYTAAKSYRPIGLLPILGKVLEKMFTNRILWQLGHDNALNPRQYGFMPQRSTEDALYDAAKLIEGAILGKKIAVAVSLDIEGAFDNAWWPAIINQLIKKKVDPSMIGLVTSYLSFRAVCVKYADEEIHRVTNKGCIQGSTCGPLLWNILLNSLLEETNHMTVHIQAFADDILVIGSGKTGFEIEETLNAALRAIVLWGKRNKLKFAPQKTQTVLFTRKLKYDQPRLYMEEVELVYSDSMKVLGLVLDKKLSYAKHLEEVEKKVVNLYKLVSRSARAQWGLNSEIIKTIYISVIEPIVLYASNVWGAKSHKLYMRKKLDRFTRFFGLMISKSHRTVSLMSCAVLASIIPLNLRATEQRDLYEVKRSKSLQKVPKGQMEAMVSPFNLPHPAERYHIRFDSINSKEEFEAMEDEWPKIYTDGSKIKGGVGAAVTFWSNNDKESHHITLPIANYCSVFQAELIALQNAIQTMTSNRRFSNAQVFSDSRSALESLQNPNTVHPIVTQIREKLKELKESGGAAHFFWIRAHVGIPGNERADQLAKLAAQDSKSAPVYDRFPQSWAKRFIRGLTIKTWQERYSSTTTGAVTKLFFPEVESAYSILRNIRLDNTKAQLFTGHGGFKKYLYRFKLSPSPFCVCDDSTIESVEHILLECPRYDRKRLDCMHRLDRDIDLNSNIGDLVKDENCRALFLDYAINIVQKAARANGSTI